ncbi:MAG: serine hydrolase domain-containing protein [Planctomycetota bacterium]|jgi:CubicO group peptidase (beta-lactamase class C family)
MRLIPSRLLAIVAGLSLPATILPAQFTPFEQAIADFDAQVAAGVAEDASGFVALAVFVGDEIVWSKGYGWADIEKRLPGTAETIGRIGSISKSVTAVLMVQLMERDILDLDDHVADAFPAILELREPPEGMEPISYRMLASHTAGLVREPDLENAAVGPLYGWEDKVLESIPKTGFKTAPWTEYSYSNIGFGMLGLACARAADRDFMRLVEEQIFAPLAMDSSSFMVKDPDQLRRLAVGYSKNRRTGEVSAAYATREHFGRGYKVPNGGIYSTVGDLARLAAAMMGVSPVQILSEESRKEIFTPQLPAREYGLGFTISPGEERYVVGHGGSVAGYNANLSFDLNSGIGVAMLRTTAYNPPSGRLLTKLLQAK